MIPRPVELAGQPPQLSFGVQLPTCLAGTLYPVPFADCDALIRIAVAAEQLGYHEVSGNDHLSTTNAVRKAWKEPPEYFESLVTLTAIGVQTSVLRLTVGTLALPPRDPVLLAKQVATLDRFTGGRVSLAVGAGHDQDEFERVSPGLKDPALSRLTTETVRSLKALFTQRLSSFSGNYRHFRDVESYPKPMQTPLPILCSGNSEAAIQRAGELGDSWLAAGLGPDELRIGRKKLTEHARHAGREPERIVTALQSVVCLDETEMQAQKRFRRTGANGCVAAQRPGRCLVGTPDQLCADLEALTEAGLDHLCASFVGDTVDEMISQMRLFAVHVLPYFAHLT
jgi:alkanesulfonate monooxygenase SsuD/methylene tetrahydromethanopterin reductase-like flavin-dependent oxidoreductase (luciferase family)